MASRRAAASATRWREKSCNTRVPLFRPRRRRHLINYWRTTVARIFPHEFCRKRSLFFSDARYTGAHTQSIESGVAVSRVLSEAGLRLHEITLRTAAGLGAIAALKFDLPDSSLVQAQRSRP